MREFAEYMKRMAFDSEEYYKGLFCVRCHKEISDAERSHCKEKHFLLLCDICYPEMYKLMEKAVPLFKNMRMKL